MPDPSYNFAWQAPHKSCSAPFPAEFPPLPKPVLLLLLTGSLCVCRWRWTHTLGVCQEADSCWCQAAMTSLWYWQCSCPCHALKFKARQTKTGMMEQLLELQHCLEPSERKERAESHQESDGGRRWWLFAAPWSWTSLSQCEECGEQLFLWGRKKRKQRIWECSSNFRNSGLDWRGWKLKDTEN